MKKYLPAIFLSITFVLLLLFLSNRSSLNFVEEQKAVSTTIPTPTKISWQTYRNEKYGFEFQYPNDLLIGNGLSVDILSVPINLPYKDRDIIPTTTTVSNIKSQIYDYFTGSISHTAVSIPYKSQYIVITYSRDISSSKNYFVDILSTFKFTNSALQNPDTSTWKTYKNEKYGFEFQYPVDWEIVDVDNSYPQLPASTGNKIVFVSPVIINSSGGQESKQLAIQVYDNQNQLKLKQFFIDQDWGEGYLKLMTNTTVNNTETVILKTHIGISPRGYYINIGDNIVNLDFSYTGLDEKSDPLIDKIFIKILSTFKFTK